MLMREIELLLGRRRVTGRAAGTTPHTATTTSPRQIDGGGRLNKRPRDGEL